MGTVDLIPTTLKMNIVIKFLTEHYSSKYIFKSHNGAINVKEHWMHLLESR